MIPSVYYGNNNKAIGIMFEINRKLYMNELTGEKNSNFSNISECVSNLVNIISDRL